MLQMPQEAVMITQTKGAVVCMEHRERSYPPALKGQLRYAAERQRQ